MIDATARPRHDDVRIIDKDTGNSFDVPMADVPDLIEALADAYNVPRLAREMAASAIFIVPVEDFRSAR